jgi:hypothetical protein
VIAILSKNSARTDMKTANSKMLPTDIHNESDLLDSMNYTTEDIGEIKESDIILNENQLLRLKLESYQNIEKELNMTTD